ncbi:site-specific DNA-methyltransferase [Candidatus Pelagibacter sp.]|jgi:DNA modification methylase|nr:site-specific DNA-methyltransferase [Candidatus Pelagibacter sp.]
MDKEKKWQKFKIDLPHRQHPYSKRNWGNGLHSLCSYQGKMKPSLVHHLIKVFSKKNELVLDPFAGSGTTMFEASLQNRNSIGFDISKIAVAISNAKVNDFNNKKIDKIISNLITYISNSEISQKTIKDSIEVKFNKTLKEYYHPKTFKEILLARDFFIKNFNIKSPEYCLILSCMLHILHGNRPYALSRRSHPLTPYAPTGEFEYKNIIEKLKKKIDLSIAHKLNENIVVGKSFIQDILKKWKIENQTVDLILTSPPFAFSTKFYINNWIRYWFGGWGIQDFEKESFNYLEKKQKKDFNVYDNVFKESKRVLKENSYLLMHLGLSDKLDMGKILLPIAEKHLKVVDLFNETVSHCEKHGIRDKGGIKEHQYLILKT